MVEDRGPQLNNIAVVLLTLTWVLFSQRVCTRLFITKTWRCDDSLLLLSQLSFTAYLVTAFIGIAAGTGGPVQDITPSKAPRALFTWWLCELLYDLTTLSVRLSIAVFLVPICFTPYQRRILYATIAIITIYSTIFFFILAFQCKPVSHFWNRYTSEVRHGHCIDKVIVPRFTFGHSVISACADFVLGGLPILMIARMRMRKREKWSIVAILATTIFAGVATIIRIPYIRVIHINKSFLHATADVGLWSAIEAAFGIMAASSFTLRPFLRGCFDAKKKMPANRADLPANRQPSHVSQILHIHSRKRPHHAFDEVCSFHPEDDVPEINRNTMNAHPLEYPRQTLARSPRSSEVEGSDIGDSRHMENRDANSFENNPSTTISRPNMIARIESHV
ncbi:hypothetical protein B7463_g6654, partial [Scytalidium lignicola]